MKTVWLTALLVALGPVASPKDAKEVCCPGLDVGGGTTSRLGQKSFSAANLIALSLEAQFSPRVKEGHLLELKVYTPHGKLYQVLSVPFSPPGPRQTVQTVDGYPRPLEVVRITPRRGYRVGSSLPVAGTWIVKNSLFGEWRADAHIDGGIRPCRSLRFTINR